MGCNLFLTDLPADELDSMQFLRSKIRGWSDRWSGLKFTPRHLANEPTGAFLNTKLMWSFFVLEKRLADQRWSKEGSKCIWMHLRTSEKQEPWFFEAWSFNFAAAVSMVDLRAHLCRWYGSRCHQQRGERCRGFLLLVRPWFGWQVNESRMTPGFKWNGPGRIRMLQNIHGAIQHYCWISLCMAIQWPILAPNTCPSCWHCSHMLGPPWFVARLAAHTAMVARIGCWFCGWCHITCFPLWSFFSENERTIIKKTWKFTRTINFFAAPLHATGKSSWWFDFMKFLQALLRMP